VGAAGGRRQASRSVAALQLVHAGLWACMRRVVQPGTAAHGAAADVITQACRCCCAGQGCSLCQGVFPYDAHLLASCAAGADPGLAWPCCCCWVLLRLLPRLREMPLRVLPTSVLLCLRLLCDMLFSPAAACWSCSARLQVPVSHCRSMGRSKAASCSGAGCCCFEHVLLLVACVALQRVLPGAGCCGTSTGLDRDSSRPAGNRCR
jgi:hypothetical protein